jgi:hypothetical protein
MISGILVGLLFVIELYVFVFFVLRRRKDDHNDIKLLPTQRVNQLIDTDLTDFAGSVDVGRICASGRVRKESRGIASFLLIAKPR